MENNIQKAQKSKKSIFNSNIFRLFIALLVLAGCAGIGAGIAILEDKSDPTSYVGGYFGKFLMQDYEEMYGYVDLEGACVPKTAFVNFMSNLRLKHDIGEYEFGELVKSGERFLMPITYLDGQTGEEKVFNVYLIKYRDNWTQLVADWRVSIDEYMVSDYSVEIPRGMKLEIDGTIVDESVSGVGTAGDYVEIGEGETLQLIPVDEAAEDRKTDIIHIFKILKGEHRARAITDYTQISKDIKVVFNRQREAMEESEIKVRDEYLTQIEKDSSEMIQEFYALARNKKKSSEKLLSYFETDDNVVSNLKKLLKKNQEVMYWPEKENIDDYKLQKCNFTELQYTAEYVGDARYKVEYKFGYDYLLTTETTLQSSYVYTISGRCDTTMEITYSIIEGQVKISELSIKNNNKKVGEEE